MENKDVAKHPTIQRTAPYNSVCVSVCVCVCAHVLSLTVAALAPAIMTLLLTREKRNQGKGESGSAYIRKAALSQNSLEDLCLYFAGQN